MSGKVAKPSNTPTRRSRSRGKGGTKGNGGRHGEYLLNGFYIPDVAVRVGVGGNGGDSLF